jgi:hypothetical protein
MEFVAPAAPNWTGKLARTLSKSLIFVKLSSGVEEFQKI